MISTEELDQIRRSLREVIRFHEAEAAKRDVVEAAEKWADTADAPRREFDVKAERDARMAVFDAVAKLRGAKGL